MLYRWELDKKVEIYRERPAKRFLVCPLGFIPILQKLQDGRLACLLRVGDLHFGERGQLAICYSPDGGESWTLPVPVTVEGSDNRNAALGQAEDGTLVVAHTWAKYVNGQFDSKAGFDRLYVVRSKDGGKSWLPRQTIRTGLRVVSPFGKVITLKDGMMLMPIWGVEKPDSESKLKTTMFGYAESFIIRSRDNGKTWGDRSPIAKGFYETSLIELPSGKMLAAMRRTPTELQARGGSHEEVWQAESRDMGYTWSEPRKLTGNMEHPADYALLGDGRLMMAYGHRTVPYGVRALMSYDEGKSWDYDNVLMLVDDNSQIDGGYPSAVTTGGRNSSVFVAYYASESLGSFTDMAFEKYGPFRAAGWQRMGIHCGGVKVRESELPQRPKKAK